MIRTLSFLIASSFALAAVDISKPIPALKLNDGRVLKHVEIVSLGTTTVMAKWEGGRGTISELCTSQRRIAQVASDALTVI